MATRPQRAAYKDASFRANGLDPGFVRNAGLLCLSAQTKEAGSVPGRSGDAARDGREAGMDLPLPTKAARHDHDLVQRAAMLAHDHGSGFEMPDRLAPALGQPIQELARADSELAEPLLLDVMCDYAGEHVARQCPWRVAAGHRPPERPKFVEAKASDAGQLGFEHLGSRRGRLPARVRLAHRLRPRVIERRR